MSHLVSVIVPVYKVEGYIEKCMQSLLDQTYKNFEALIVNDGSPDKSIEFAKAVVGDDPRFIFFEKENGGQGTARNLALDNAKGDYIAFLDSDDYYENDYLDVMLEKIIKDDAEICVCDLRNVSVDGSELSIRKNNVALYYDNKDYLMAHGYISNYMWDKIFKANCFDGFRFDPAVRTYEDVHLLFRVLYDKKITSVDSVLYNYVQRPGSTMNSLPKTYIDDRYEIYVEIKKFYNEKLCFDEFFKNQVSYYFLNNYILHASINIVKYSKFYSFDIARLLSKDQYKLFSVKKIISNNLLSNKTKISLLILKTNPHIYKLFINMWLKLNYGRKSI